MIEKEWIEASKHLRKKILETYEEAIHDEAGLRTACIRLAGLTIPVSFENASSFENVVEYVEHNYAILDSLAKHFCGQKWRYTIHVSSEKIYDLEILQHIEKEKI